ncbi:MAG: hypothetical protein K8F62_17380 [Pseudorhodoplanes sp.]|nr:hypothetical protein [Pseudorhodoplanes sp.]
MNVVRLPVVPRTRPEDEPASVMARALAHMDSVIAIYRQVGSRPNPVTILTMVASILDDSELRKAAGIDAARGEQAGADSTGCLNR